MSNIPVKYDPATGKHYLENIKAAELDTDVTEFIQDTAGAMLVDTDSVDFTYDDTTGEISADVIVEDGAGLEIGASGVKIDTYDLYYLQKGLSCCHTDVLHEHVSTGSGDKISLDAGIPTGLILHGDPCFFYKVRLEGSWGTAAADNDQSIDFASSPDNKIFVQFMTRPIDSGPWTFVRSEQIDYASGTTIDFDFEFLYLATTPTYVSLNLSRYDDETFTDVVNPTGNYANYWYRMTITKCPKPAWFKSFTIPASAYAGTSPITGFIPSSLTEGLPWDGYYKVDIYLKVLEEENFGAIDANLTDPQYLEVRPYGGTWREIDRSGTHVQYSPGDDYATNRSLQGSCILNVVSATDGARDIEWRVYLPNGVNKQVLGGYADIRYIGPAESPVAGA